MMVLTQFYAGFFFLIVWCTIEKLLADVEFQDHTDV
jgi:hypothetical protein